MPQTEMDRPIVRMPDLVWGDWINTDHPLTKEQLRGQVVLVDFWEYTCINCLRSLPYLKRWHERYHDKGLTVIGIHSPEFEFSRSRAQVVAAVEELGIRYPVLMDNELRNWEQFANKAWPTKYLVDPAGYIRYQWQGEGRYQTIERAIQRLLRQRDPDVSLPEPLPPLRQEDQPGAVCYRTTPELYTGYAGGGFFGGALGNPEGYLPERSVVYELPEPAARQQGRFYLEGIWRAGSEYIAYVGQTGGRILLPYRALGVNAVLSHTSDPVELMLDMRPTEEEPIVEVRQDGRWLTPESAGADITFDERGRSIICVTRPRMMELTRNPAFGAYELELIFRATGLALYSFTFTTCAAPSGAQETFQMP